MVLFMARSIIKTCYLCLCENLPIHIYDIWIYFHEMVIYFEYSKPYKNEAFTNTVIGFVSILLFIM